MKLRIAGSVGLVIGCAMRVSCFACDDVEDTFTRLQSMYFSHLCDAKLDPHVDSDGDITFEKDGAVFYIRASETAKDEHYFSYCCLAYTIDSVPELMRVTLALGMTNAEVKVAKGYVVGERVDLSVESFLAAPEQFTASFERSVEVLQVARSSFMINLWSMAQDEEHDWNF
ncbi:MAG: hypothetical protein IPH83_20635 [Gammaproteobacteria bacterium]|nr:hypothetical protein [Gammaproteobacteria bacterium]